MAIITADQIDYSTQGTSSAVGFFSLKNDGEEAIVRIMCDSMADLEIMTVHPVTVGNSAFPNRQVNCLRSPRDPLEMCPLCASGEKVRQKVFIKMLQYDPITKVATPVVWDRVASVFAPRIKSFIDNYGPLSHIMCKIIRHGTGKNTIYDIIPNINPQEYNETNYPILPDAFKDFSVLGRMVMDKNAEDILTFMRTGSFPEKPVSQTNQNQYNQPQYSQPPQNSQPQYSTPYQNIQQNTYQQPTYSNNTINNEGFGGTSPFNNQGSSQNLERPVRY